MRSISIFGATGSIGESAFDLLMGSGGPEAWRTVALTGGRNVARLAEMARALRAEIAVIADEALLPDLRAALAGTGTEAAAGTQDGPLLLARGGQRFGQPEQGGPAVDGLAPDGQHLVAGAQLVDDAGGRGGDLSHDNAVGGDTLPGDDAREDDHGEDEVEDRPRRHGGKPCPQRRAAQRLPRTRRVNAAIARDTGRVGVAEEADVAPQGDRRHLPHGPAPVAARQQARAEAQRENLGPDAGPAADNVMPVFMDAHDDRQRHDEGHDRPGKPAHLSDKFLDHAAAVCHAAASRRACASQSSTASRLSGLVPKP